MVERATEQLIDPGNVLAVSGGCRESQHWHQECLRLQRQITRFEGRERNGFVAHTSAQEFVMGTSIGEIAVPQNMEEGRHSCALEELTTLVSERLDYFHRIARPRLENTADAEDAVQDAFLSAWKHIGKFKGQARMSTWLTVIVMNSARMVARKRLRHPHVPLDGSVQDDESLRLSEMIPDTRPDPEEVVCRMELQQRLRQLSDHLSPTLGEVIRLCGIEGLSVRQAADSLGVTVSAVKSRAVRARRELRRLDCVKPGEVTASVPRRRTPRRRAATSRI
jgi:RNA polymerase sigma-70 factor, ECF subfamily